MPVNARFEPYTDSSELIKFKKEIRARQQLQAQEINSESSVILKPEEKVKRILISLLVELKQVRVEERDYLMQSVKLPEIRKLVADFL
jgi:hypothetical protein